MAACHELGASVDGERLCKLALADLKAVHDEQGDESLSLQEAAKESGYNRDSLSRMIREGRLTDVGAKRRPRLRRADLPKRPCSNAQPTTALASHARSTAPSAHAIAREAMASRTRAREE